MKGECNTPGIQREREKRHLKDKARQDHINNIPILTPQQRLTSLDRRGLSAKKERARLISQL